MPALVLLDGLLEVQQLSRLLLQQRPRIVLSCSSIVDLKVLQELFFLPLFGVDDGAQFLDSALVFHQLGWQVVLHQLLQSLSLLIVCVLCLIVLDLQIRGVLLQRLQLGFLQFPGFLEGVDFGAELGVGALDFQEGGFLLDQDALELLVLVLDLARGLLQALHCGHVLDLEAVDVGLEAVFHELLLLVHDLPHRHLLVHAVPLLS